MISHLTGLQMNTVVKKCFKCHEEKPLSGFYEHPMMADGHLNKCKECTKNDTRNNRLTNIEKYREYDRLRGNRQGYEYVKQYREKYPNKAKAHRAVNFALRRGNLKKGICEVCGSNINVVAHHDNYLEVLKVRWMCQAHHKQWHRDNGEGDNP